jgi:hypothetical protein
MKKFLLFFFSCICLLFCICIFYYIKPLNLSESNLNKIQILIYKKRVEYKSDSTAFDILIKNDLPTNRSYWNLLILGMKANIEPAFLVEKTLFIGHDYKFSELQEQFIINYINHNKIMGFDEIYCDYKNEKSINLIFMTKLKNQYYPYNIDCNKYNDSFILDFSDK